MSTMSYRADLTYEDPWNAMYPVSPAALNLMSSGVMWLAKHSFGGMLFAHMASVRFSEESPIRNCVPTLIFVLFGKGAGSQAGKQSGYP